MPSGVPLPVSQGTGTFDPATATWYLRTTASPGTPSTAPFQFGPAGAVPLVGDWSGAGKGGIGAFDPTSATWYLRNELSSGAPDAGQFQFGGAGSIPVVGDWLGTGKDLFGVFDPKTALWSLTSQQGGAPDVGQFQFGPAGSIPIVGDWLGTGKDGIGAFDPTTATFYLRNELSSGAADAGQFQFGSAGSLPLVGDWSGTGKIGVGTFDPTTSTFSLRSTLSSGAADVGQFVFGGLGWLPVVGDFSGLPSVGTIIHDLPGPTDTTSQGLLTVNLKPLDINLLGLEVQTNQIQVTVSAQSGQGQLLGNVLNTVSNLVNLKGVNNALNNVLDSVVTLLNSASLSVSGVTTTGSLGNATAATIPVLDAFIAPVHLNLLGAVVDTSPIHLTITAHSGSGLVLGNVVSDLANLFNPPLPDKLDLDFINSKLQDLLGQLNAQIPGIPASPVTITPTPNGTERVVSLALAPIDVNLLGLVLQTSQIQVNADAVTGNGDLLGNVLTTLLNTLGATPQNLTTLSNNLNAILGKVIGVLNASSLTLPTGIVGTLAPVLQTLAVPNLINQTGAPAQTPVLNLAIASSDGTTPPVDVNLLGLVITTSNIQAQLIAQTGDGQILGNLVYNVANLLNPGGTLGVLSVLNDLGI